ncbi:MAG: nucleotidyl transferase AbiEii/AbiGii toxin family protein [Thermoflexibacter sp.]|jgi:hypothetical protein|nr:nucleotidyl transferase AbiEii/AbiGii toxin family protein [Thermoflexibacter sp.]
MKLAAIAGRGRKRDFIDIFFLLQTFSFEEIMDFYNQKFADGNELMVARSLSYFDDADQDTDLNLLKKADWEMIKSQISQQVSKRYG